jgi:protein-S-isoprenylcysteine O-methyltransferase Ste14
MNSFNTDLLLYVLHFAFWASFGVTHFMVRQPAQATEATPNAQDAAQRTAPYSRLLVIFHSLGFGVMYFGIGNAVLGHRVPEWFDGQRIVGALAIMAGGALMSWARAYFASWRFRAKLDEGHQLATGGPFKLFRHPLYLGLSLLALGSAIWAPTTANWIAFVLMAIGGDLRGRSEEALLAQAFGHDYTNYCARTKRFIPGIY